MLDHPLPGFSRGFLLADRPRQCRTETGQIFQDIEPIRRAQREQGGEERDPRQMPDNVLEFALSAVTRRPAPKTYRDKLEASGAHAAGQLAQPVVSILVVSGRGLLHQPFKFDRVETLTVAFREGSLQLSCVIDPGEIDRRLTWSSRRVRDPLDQTAPLVERAVRFLDHVIGTGHERVSRGRVGADVVKNLDRIQLQDERDQDARGDREGAGVELEPLLRAVLRAAK